MKSKVLVVLSTLILAVGMMSQTVTPSAAAPASADNSAKACTCCSHGHKTPDGKMACAKDGKSCCGDMAMSSNEGKDGKSCPMMAKNKDGKMACCADGKCLMMSKDAKGCCAKGSGCCGKEGKCCGESEAPKVSSKAACCPSGVCCAKGSACCMSTAVSASVKKAADADCCKGM